MIGRGVRFPKHCGRLLQRRAGPSAASCRARFYFHWIVVVPPRPAPFVHAALNGRLAASPSQGISTAMRRGVLNLDRAQTPPTFSLARLTQCALPFSDLSSLKPRWCCCAALGDGVVEMGRKAPSWATFLLRPRRRRCTVASLVISECLQFALAPALPPCQEDNRFLPEGFQALGAQQAR